MFVDSDAYMQVYCSRLQDGEFPSSLKGSMKLGGHWDKVIGQNKQFGEVQRLKNIFAPLVLSHIVTLPPLTAHF